MGIFLNTVDDSIGDGIVVEDWKYLNEARKHFENFINVNEIRKHFENFINVNR